MATEVLQAALDYAGNYGWKIVPVPHRSKGPVLPDWQNQASSDEETICNWLGDVAASNVGVLLGEKSGLVDVECDDEEAEETLAKLFSGAVPIVPTFSANRGKHRLFKWQGNLPFPEKNVFKIGKLEIRTGNKGGAQSIFPPSIHPTGKAYQWLTRPEEAPLGTFPGPVIVRMWNAAGEDSVDFREMKKKKSAFDWADIIRPRAEGDDRNNSEAAYVGGLLRRLPNLDDNEGMQLMYLAAAAINARNIDPQPDYEFERTFQSILRAEHQRRATEGADAVLSRTPEQITAQGAKDGLRVPEGMKIIIVHDDPPFYELHAPQFHKSPGGFIKLTATQLCSVQALRIQALEQAGYPLPKAFTKAWEAKGGLFEQLVLSAEHRSVTPITKQLAITADYLLGRLEEAKPRPEEAEGPDHRRPTMMQDGSVWFRWEETWRDGLLNGSVKREDVKRLAHAIGVDSDCIKYWPHKGRGRKRYVCFGKELMSMLANIAEAAETPPAHSALPYIGMGNEEKI